MCSVPICCAADCMPFATVLHYSTTVLCFHFSRSAVTQTCFALAQACFICDTSMFCCGTALSRYGLCAYPVFLPIIRGAWNGLISYPVLRGIALSSVHGSLASSQDLGLNGSLTRGGGEGFPEA